ncbi:MAG: hypothetical protein ACQER7_08985 [Bacteroidota bacterium]
MPRPPLKLLWFRFAVDSTGKWQTELSPSLLLVAENDSAQTTLNPRKKQWSHQK